MLMSICKIITAAQGRAEKCWVSQVIECVVFSVVKSFARQNFSIMQFEQTVALCGAISFNSVE